MAVIAIFKYQIKPGRLPDFMKQVVLMAYYQGLKYQEIAEILDIPLGTVKSRLHAALVKLTEIWNEHVCT